MILNKYFVIFLKPLDRIKLERKTKYLNYNKGEAIQKGQKSKKKHVDESYGLPELGEYIAVLAIPLPNKIYQEITDKLSKLDKDLGKAFLKLINFKETEPKG